jgi:hypothetical protein
MFPLTSVSRQTLRSTQSPVQRVPGVVSPVLKAAGQWRWQLTPSSAEVKNNYELYLLSSKRLHGVYWERFSFLKSYLHFNLLKPNGTYMYHLLQQ